MQQFITQVSSKPLPIWEYIGNASEGAEMDNYVHVPFRQAQGDTWSVVYYNRYAYCLNNPLKYTDPSGELYVIDSWISGLLSGSVFKEANKRAMNDIKIWGGLKYL